MTSPKEKKGKTCNVFSCREAPAKGGKHDIPICTEGGGKCFGEIFIYREKEREIRQFWDHYIYNKVAGGGISHNTTLGGGDIKSPAPLFSGVLKRTGEPTKVSTPGTEKRKIEYLRPTSCRVVGGPPWSFLPFMSYSKGDSLVDVPLIKIKEKKKEDPLL